MQLFIPTSDGKEILYTPFLSKEVLKDSLKCMLDSDVRFRHYFSIGVVADTLYPKLYKKFRVKSLGTNPAIPVSAKSVSL